MARALPGAPVHTSFFDPTRTYPELATLDIHPMPINRIGPLRAHHRLAFPILAPSLLPALSLIYLFGNQGLLKGWLFGQPVYGPVGIIAGMRLKPSQAPPSSHSCRMSAMSLAVPMI